MESIKSQRHCHCFICLHQTYCLKVVELKASQEQQANTLYLLLKLVQSDSELFSQFVSQDCHKLLLKVLQSPRCIAGHHMLKVGMSLQANIGIMSLKCRSWKFSYHILSSSVVHVTTWHHHCTTNWHRTSLANLLQRLATLTEYFMPFLSPFRQMPGWYFKLGQSHFLPHLFQVITHESFCHLLLWNIMRCVR